MPVEAGPPAADFGHELFVDDIHGVSFITGAGHILDVEEGLSAGVPDGCCHHQSQQPSAQEVNTSVEGGVGEEEEGCQQEQRPPPGHFDKIPGKRKKLYQLICTLNQLWATKQVSPLGINYILN